MDNKIKIITILTDIEKYFKEIKEVRLRVNFPPSMEEIERDLGITKEIDDMGRYRGH